MEVDWITVGAQIANFLVLVWVLQRLLYRPVTRAMEQRAAEIRDRFTEAERREAEAETEAERLHAERRALQDERAAQLEVAQQEAHALRHRLEEEAREEVTRRRAAWADQLSREQSAFLSDLRREMAEQAMALSRKLLRDLAGAGLEEVMSKRFIDRLEQLDDAARAQLRTEAAGSGDLVVTSAFDLPEDTRTRLREAIRATLDTDEEVAFERDAAIVCGIRLKVGGQTLQWSIDAYLDDLEAGIAAALDDNEGRTEAEEST